MDAVNQKIVIDEEFKDFVFPHTALEREQLKNSLLKEGCRDEIILWDGIIIDGHMRYAICTELGISFRVIDKKDMLPTREDVKQWIILNQLARRNLTPEMYKYYVGTLYNEKKLANGGDRSHRQIDDVKTSEVLSKLLNTSSSTIERAGKYVVAIDKIASECGQEYRNKIIFHDIDLTQEAVIQLSESKNIMEQVQKLESGKMINVTVPKRKQKIRPEKEIDLDSFKPDFVCPKCGFEFFKNDA